MRPVVRHRASCTDHPGRLTAPPHPHMSPDTFAELEAVLRRTKIQRAFIPSKPKFSSSIPIPPTPPCVMRIIDHSSISWRPHLRLNISSPGIRISKPHTTAACRSFQPPSLPVYLRTGDRSMPALNQQDATYVITQPGRALTYSRLHTAQQTRELARAQSIGTLSQQDVIGSKHFRLFRNELTPTEPEKCERTLKSFRSEKGTQFGQG